jgi:serine phosphatase RsbU (regulator of sigma subunit)/anti-sigma regulatory factor (Ser/Thr protein kinase)
MHERIAEDRLHALQRVTDAALSYLPFEAMLTELLTRVRELLGVDTAAILLIEDDGKTLLARAAKGLEEEVEREVRVPVGRGFAGRIAAEKRPVFIPDVATADVVNPILRQKKLVAMLGVPLLVETNVIGVMHVGSLTPRAFDEQDVEVLQRAADRAALAIGGRLGERERGLADAFQRSLMPPLPSIPGLALAARYKPAAAAQLGGDWYDAFVLPTGAVGVAIGDVVGRGFHAAAVMGQLRSALRAFALDERSPAEVLSRLGSLLRQLEPGWSATLLYALLEPHASRVTLARAGHPPPLLVDADGNVDYLDLPGGVPLGATRHAMYDDLATEMLASSTLVLYTDGLIEHAGESLDAGLERLREAVRADREDPQDVCDDLTGALLPGGAENDDAAFLVLRVSPLTDPFSMSVAADPDSVTLVRRVVSRWLDELGASQEEIGEITLACSEACANAIEHAYGPEATEFEVEIGSSAGKITITVRDTGRWREPRGTNRGRGLTLMEGLMDEVDVQSSEDGTVVALSRKLMAHAA